MVKADYKRDYYADLDLPSIADTETIKKRFRELAKQYHPDRNPGREVDVVPKFQAIQAAHEILGDPVQKIKYDAERAKLNRPRDAESPTFRKPPPPRRADSGYPNGVFPQPGAQPPPRRDPSANRYGPQTGPRPASRPQSASADKFAQFARAGAQWDRAKYEDAARQEGLRGMNAMRGGATPQTSPLRTRHPTAPKPASADPYSSGPEPSPGFPGLNRTASARRFAPDEQPPRSAYSRYHADRDRPPSAGPFGNVEPQPHHRPRESVSPLRQTRSYQSEDFNQARPGLSRTSSRYARTGGEKTQVNTANIGRSASVRNSPIGSKWEDQGQGPFGAQSSAEARTPRPRHRSHSPQARTGAGKFEYASQTSSDESEDDIPPPQARKKAPLRRPQTHHGLSGDAGLTGYFPNTNYTKVVDDSSTYDYPAPESKGTPVRKPFANMTSPVDHQQPTAQDASSRSSSEEEASRHHSHQQDRNHEHSPFVADKWHEDFQNNPNLFNPPEPAPRDRKSPSKNLRGSRSGQARTFAPTKDARRDAINGGIDPSIIAGVRHINPTDAQSKSAAFQSGKLAPDFADRVNATRRGSVTGATGIPVSSAGEPDLATPLSRDEQPTSDEMDVDSPAPPDSGSPTSPVNVSIEEEQSPTTSNSHPSPHHHNHRHSSDTRANGFNLHDLKKTAPFAPSDTGLKDLNDITSSLPFPSRPAENLEALHRTPSSTLRHLNLPRPPKTPNHPGENDLNQKSWDRYRDAMTLYMHDWTKFNGAMIEHFRARQEAVTHGMYRNWMCGQFDGATAEDFEASGWNDRAGYATYMTWLEDDRKCRTWWDVAFEEHRVCMAALGAVRRKLKEMNARA